MGRPDVPGADDFGLVDINHASEDALCHLPGITAELARRVAETRERVGSFTSVEDVGAHTDVLPSVVDAMRDYAVFL